MSESPVGRREFLKRAGIVGVAAAAEHGLAPATPAEAQTAAPNPGSSPPLNAAGYTYLKPDEVEFVEALVDHMIPKDELTGSGTEIGIATFIDRALAGSWGKGDRLYMQGPWLPGTANQGYQLPLTPAELYRVAIAGCDAYCRKTFGKDFSHSAAEQKEAFLKDLAAGKITLAGGLPGRAFFTMFYENVMEGLFADPIYGGNKDKAGWKMIGFPGVMANNAEHVKTHSDGKKYNADPVSIADMS
jgi:gluconate 2-dehydrogenase gamma chain